MFWPERVCSFVASAISVTESTASTVVSMTTIARANPSSRRTELSDRIHMSDLTVTLSMNLVLRPRFVRTMKSSWTPVTALAVVVVFPFAS